MTREEATDILFKKIRSYSGEIVTNEELVSLADIEKLIWEIYDSFENHICVNCKYYKASTGECLHEDNMCASGEDEEMYYTYLSVYDEFGCNRFDRREK